MSGHLTDEVVLADRADGLGFIEGYTFQDQALLGPAIVAIISHVEITDSVIDIDPNDVDASFVIVPPRKIIGAVALRHVTIRRCEFRGIGFIGTASMIASIKKSLFGEGWDVEHSPT